MWIFHAHLKFYNKHEWSCENMEKYFFPVNFFFIKSGSLTIGKFHMMTNDMKCEGMTWFDFDRADMTILKWSGNLQLQFIKSSLISDIAMIFPLYQAVVNHFFVDFYSVPSVILSIFYDYPMNVEKNNFHQNCLQFFLVIPSFNARKCRSFNFQLFSSHYFALVSWKIFENFSIPFSGFLLLHSALTVHCEFPANMENSLHQVWLLNFLAFFRSLNKEKLFFSAFL